MTRFWDGWSDCTPRPAFAFGDAGKKEKVFFTFFISMNVEDNWYVMTVQ